MGDDSRSTGALFQQLGLPEEAHVEFQSHLAQRPALEASNAPAFLKSLFGEFLSATWFQVPGADSLTWARRGSRPGDCFADVCFAFAFAKILQKAEHSILSKYPHLGLPWSGQSEPEAVHLSCQLGLLMPIWADDLAVALWTDLPSDMLHLLPQVAGCLFNVLASAGLAPKARRVLVEWGNTIPVTGLAVTGQLRIVGFYRHLGTVLQSGTALRRDLAAKYGTAHQTMTKFKSQLFCNKQMPLRVKVQYFRSLVLSAIFYNSATWMLVSKRQKHQAQAGLHKLYKRLAIAHIGQIALDWSWKKTCVLLHLPDLETTLILERLRYIQYLARLGQPHLWGLVQLEKHWWFQIKKDLLWLAELCPELQLSLDEPFDWPRFCNDCHSSKAWKRTIARARARALADQERVFEWEAWHSHIFRELADHRLIPSHHVPRCGLQEFFCIACRQKFKTAAALAVHQFKKHQRLTLARYFVQGTCCEACLKEYHTHLNLINHVNRKATCRGFYQQRGQIVEAEAGVNSRDAVAGRPSLTLPFLQSEGPRPLAPSGPDVDPFYDQEVARLRLCWTSTCATYRTRVAELLEELRKASLTAILTPSELARAF